MASSNSSQILKNLLAMLAGGGLGAVGGGFGGGGIGGVLAGAAGAAAGDPAGDFIARQYPREFAPEPYHNFNVTWVDSPTANENAEGHANMGIIQDAGRMQTLEEHNRAIRQFLRPGMTPQEQRQAIHRGLEAEKSMPQYWNESRDRRPFSVSSSAVDGIRIAPDGRVEVKWHSSPTWYTFKQYPDTYQASLAAQKLLKSKSIGRAVYPVVSRNMSNTDLGSWNRDNYDPAFAKA